MDPLVGIILGSKSDLPHTKQCTDALDEFGVPYKIVIASAHRSPNVLHGKLKELEKTVGVFIAFAGMSAHLPGVVASQTIKPVVGVPVSVSLMGLDALLSIAQMPPGVPVAAMAIDGGRNAAIYAVGILAPTEAGKKLKLGDKLTQMRNKKEAEYDMLNKTGQGRIKV